MLKSQRWSFTTWKLPDFSRPALISYMIFQREISSNDKIHYQGYVEFHKPYSQKQVKALFRDGGMHVEISRESKTANVFYCTKNTFALGYRYCLENGKETIFDSSKFDDLDSVFDLK